MQVHLRKFLTAAAAVLPLVVGYGSVSAHAEGEHYVFVSHAPDTDSWWNVIKNALKNAAAETKTTVDYRNPPTGDIADMARIIQQAAATNPDGIITTIADFDVLQSAIQDAVAKGIPVITVNSGTAEQSRQLGALMHIGQPEYDAGKAPANAPRRPASLTSSASTTTSPTPPPWNAARAMPTASAFRSATIWSIPRRTRRRSTTR